MMKKNNMQNLLVTLGLLIITSIRLNSQDIYEINTTVPQERIYSGHLNLGGSSPEGENISVNNYYISLNNKPMIPVIGEFHFSRYPHQYWDESIKKMKAAGITVISTYVFWNLHEEEEGKFVWTGDKNVREFIELCKKNNVYTIVRIGPFCHGEIRNGGLPDWLLAKPLNIRMNDPLYLSYVEKLYNQIGIQLKGLYFKDGGPIIGTQIENEYQHSAAPWGITYPGQPLDLTVSERDLSVTYEGVSNSQVNNEYSELGNDHMKTLKSLAEKSGIITPLYTATGWGYAAIIPNESIPVTAAYAYPFWTSKRDISPFFLYKNLHKNPDYPPVRYKPEDYPSFSSELGSGISLVYTRRPIVVHQSFDAMVNRCLGSGTNGIGYYMFHSGSTPRGKNNYMNDEAYGLTKISYEYQSPIGEYGQIREGYQRLKLIHFFLKEFGNYLAPMTVVLPSNAAKLTPENINELRYSVRVKDNSGFLFVNNFQDDTTMLDQTNIQVRIMGTNGEIKIPEIGGFNLKSGENVIFPFNLNINGTKLNYATAQLLTKSESSNPYYVFFTPEGTSGEFSFTKGISVKNIHGVTIKVLDRQILVKCTENVSEFTINADRKQTNILVIDKKLALKSYVVTIKGQKSLIFSNASVLESENSLELLSTGTNSFEVAVYPRIASIPTASLGTVKTIAGNAAFSTYQITLPQFVYTGKTSAVNAKKIAITIPQTIPDGVNDVYLTLDYIGDTGMGFLNNDLVADNFYNGIPWQLGLRKFISEHPQEMIFYFRPMENNATYLQDLQQFPQFIPDFGRSNSFLKINSITFTTQYKSTLMF